MTILFCIHYFIMKNIFYIISVMSWLWQPVLCPCICFPGAKSMPPTCYGITPPWSYMLLLSGMLYDLCLIQMITGIDEFIFCLLVLFISEDKLKSLLFLLLVFLLPLLWSSSVMHCIHGLLWLTGRLTILLIHAVLLYL